MGEKKLSLKLHIDTKAKKVLFAEAGRDFVDFLFRIFVLPYGAVVNLLRTKGNLADLSKGIQALNPDSYQPNLTARNLFKCSANQYIYCRNYVTDVMGTICPKCKAQMCTPMTYVDPETLTEMLSSGGNVEGIVTYIVMDNLEVKPSSIRLTNSFNLNDVSSIDHKQVLVGIDEAIAILKTSLESQAVLTTVFLDKLTADLPEEFLPEYEMMWQDKVMEERRDRKKALAAYIDDMRNKLYNKHDGFVSRSKDEFTARLEKVDRWIYEEGANETESVYIEKLEELKKQGDTIDEQYKEYLDRIPKHATHVLGPTDVKNKPEEINRLCMQILARTKLAKQKKLDRNSSF